VCAARPEWAFDAVYTPVETDFRSTVLASAPAFLSAAMSFTSTRDVQAFEIFSGLQPDEPWVRSVITRRA
jgi:shikimate dehydrogenase